MNKLYLLLISLFLLVGCGTDGLEGFTKQFNKHAKKNDVPEIIKDFGEIQDEENMS